MVCDEFAYLLSSTITDQLKLTLTNQIWWNKSYNWQYMIAPMYIWFTYSRSIQQYPIHTHHKIGTDEHTESLKKRIRKKEFLIQHKILYI